jgi:protein SCO1/2
MNTTPSSAFRRHAFLAVIALAAIVGGVLSASQLFKARPVEPEGLQASYLPGGKPLPAFELLDHHDRPFDKQRLKGHWTFVFFGYTYCPDACPMALATLNAVIENLQDQGLNQPPQVVMVSVDPARDTTERLAAYVPYFNPAFIGATGTDEELVKLTRDLGIIYVVREPAPGGSGYLVDHSTAILLINPEGELQAVFGQPHSPQPMADDFLKIMRHEQS